MEMSAPTLSVWNAPDLTTDHYCFPIETNVKVSQTIPVYFFFVKSWISPDLFQKEY